MAEFINKIKLDIIGLYKTDYKNSFHVREIAKLIGTSHVALFPHLKELENNRILESRTVGRNKIFSIVLKNILIKDLLSISEKSFTLKIIKSDKFIGELYEDFNDLAGCMIVFDYKNQETDIKMMYIGNQEDLKNKKIKELGQKYSKKIKILSGNYLSFEKELIKQSGLIKDIIKDHIILTNQDIFINLMYKYFNSN